MHPRPERVPQPLPRLLVGAQREPEFLLGVDEELFVDDRRQDRPRQQVADVVLAAGEDPLLRDVLAGLLDPLAGRAEPGCRQVRRTEVDGGSALACERNGMRSPKSCAGDGAVIWLGRAASRRRARLVRPGRGGPGAAGLGGLGRRLRGEDRAR